jgi:type IV fimbrial biogenesis protein FimT
MRQHGLTLLELMIALAMLAVVASLALPSFGAAAERARLKDSAETLAADLAEARFEAASRGQPLYVAYHAGGDWCWSVATAPGCPCGTDGATSCQLKRVQASEHAGIELLEPQDTVFDPTGVVGGAGGAMFQSSRGERLRVNVSALGRASICVALGTVAGYSAC